MGRFRSWGPKYKKVISAAKSSSWPQLTFRLVVIVQVKVFPFTSESLFSYIVSHPPLQHKMVSILAVFAATIAVATAQSATPSVNLFVDDSIEGDVAYAASIVSACKDQTVYAMQCTSAELAGSATCGADAPVSHTSTPEPHDVA